MAFHGFKILTLKKKTKSKLIQAIIYKRHQVGWHLKYFQKLISKENLEKLDSFWVSDKKNPLCDILETFSLCIQFPHQNTFFCKFN
jgi:hypothetical protein